MSETIQDISFTEVPKEPKKEPINIDLSKFKKLIDPDTKEEHLVCTGDQVPTSRKSIETLVSQLNHYRDSFEILSNNHKEVWTDFNKVLDGIETMATTLDGNSPKRIAQFIISSSKRKEFTKKIDPLIEVGKKYRSHDKETQDEE